MSKSNYGLQGGNIKKIRFPSSYSKNQIDMLKSQGWFLTKMGEDVIIALGPNMTTGFYDEVFANREQGKTTVIVITGTSDMENRLAGLRLCEIFDSGFLPSKQIVFKHESLLKIISRDIMINSGQCLVIDGMRMDVEGLELFNIIQKEFVDQVDIVRSMGIIIIFFVQQLSMINKIIRQHSPFYHIRIDKKGIINEYKVIVSSSKSKELREYQIGLTLPGMIYCVFPSCFDCLYVDKCVNIRAVYERRKKLAMEERSEL